MLENRNRDHVENQSIDIPMPSNYEELQQFIAKSFQDLGAAVIERDDGSMLLPADISFTDGEEICLRVIARNPSKIITAKGLHYLWEQKSYELLCKRGRQIYSSSSS